MHSWFNWASINFGFDLLVTERLMEFAWTLVEVWHSNWVELRESTERGGLDLVGIKIRFFSIVLSFTEF